MPWGRNVHPAVPTGTGDDTEIARLQVIFGDSTSFASLTRTSKSPAPSAFAFRSCLRDRLKAPHRSLRYLVRFSVVTTIGVDVAHGTVMVIAGDAAFLLPVQPATSTPQATTNAAPHALVRIATHRCYQLQSSPPRLSVDSIGSPTLVG